MKARPKTRTGTTTPFPFGLTLIQKFKDIKTQERFRQVLNGIGHLCTLEKLNEAVERFGTL
jgi:hypothetical protein